MGLIVNGVKVTEFSDDVIDLREEVRARELDYKRALRQEAIDKFVYVCIKIVPSLVRAIFDPTVRRVTLNVVRPLDGVLENNCTESKTGKLKVHSEDMMQKAIYFEELYKEWN